MKQLKLVRPSDFAGRTKLNRTNKEGGWIAPDLVSPLLGIEPNCARSQPPILLALVFPRRQLGLASKQITLHTMTKIPQLLMCHQHGWTLSYLLNRTYLEEWRSTSLSGQLVTILSMCL